MFGSSRKFSNAKDRLVGVVLPSYRVKVIEARDNPFLMRSSADDQNVKTMLDDKSACDVNQGRSVAARQV
jgi:hypothetical protein